MTNPAPKDEDDLSNVTSSPSSTERRVSTTSASTDYHHTVGAGMHSQVGPDYWPGVPEGIPGSSNEMVKVRSHDTAGYSPRATGSSGIPPMQPSIPPYIPMQNQMMGSSTDTSMQQPRTESGSPLHGDIGHPGGPQAHQTYYGSRYNTYPDPRYAPQSQEAYYSVQQQNLRQHQDASNQAAIRRPSRGAWNQGPP